MSIAIRQFAASPRGSVLAAGEFQQRVHLWDIRTLQLLRTIETSIDFGGHRLAISDDGKTLGVGAYHVHGIAAYSVADGTEIWRRKDLKKVQQITFNGDQSRLFCCFERGACENLDAITGKSGKTVRNAQKIWENSFGNVHFIETRSGDYLLCRSGEIVAKIPRQTFAILTAAFSESAVVFSEAGGAVRCIKISDGKERWRHLPPKGTHFLELAFCEPAGQFIGVSVQFERRGQKSLHTFDGRGTASVLADIGRPADVVFCQRGSKLISSDGEMFEAFSGRLVARLLFPNRGKS